MAVSTRLKELLEKEKVAFKLEKHDVAYTAQEVAAATHVRGKELVKTVVVVADGKHLLAAMPAARKIDFKLLKEFLGAKSVRLAEEGEFAQDFPDCEIGAMPPFGNLYGLRLIAAQPLQSDDEVVFNAGNHQEVIHMKRADWERLAQPDWATFTKPVT